MRHIAAVAVISILVLAGGRCCHAQNVSAGDLRQNGSDRDSTSVATPPAAFPALRFGMSALPGPLRLGGLPVPEGPMTAYDVYNMQLSKISSGLYPSMQRNFSATMWTPSRGEFVLYSIAGLFLTPYAAVPYGYWAYNPSFPFALLTKVPDYRDYGNMYSPELIPQYIRTVRDEKTGIYMQEAVPIEQINTSGWHLGGTDISPINLGPQTPVERDMQRLSRGYGF